MFEIIAVTNRGCCPAGHEFAAQAARIAASGAGKVILREKDLTPEAYKGLAGEFLRNSGGILKPSACRFTPWSRPEARCAWARIT